MKKTIQYLLKGLAILLPIIVTIALVRWLLVTIEAWLSPVWLSVLGDHYYLPGLAFVSFLVIAVIIGFSSRWTTLNRLWMLPGRIMERMPVLRSLYATLTDIFDLMAGKNFAKESVVLVNFPGTETKLIGIVTRQHNQARDKLSQCLGDDEVAVYLPMSYMVGGYMVMVPRHCVTPLDMSPADAMQLVISGGLGKGHKENS
ncbi:DUF502 domain-containing protein [Pseudidiomarina taiwanensis]|uniref:DUF502 domain-containing protein n=1 Tax=Pseudidiomarina taiwanensis TaxID=337250 RepID=A0A432ZEI6_9GAMM|nr:DUF502 domain-containing protein [Pseudidiomarina taiwanensis]RUO76376.1 hypothetical protein CWI83_08415 [Pseudidiomarina taiwanensis]